MSLNSCEIQEVFGRVWVQTILKPFLWSSSLCQNRYPIVNWPLRSTIELCFEFFHNIVKSYCTTLLTESRWVDVYPFSFKNRIRNGRERGFAFATSFPVTLCTTFSREMVSNLSGYVFVNSVHNSNPRSCSVSSRDSIMISMP